MICKVYMSQLFVFVITLWAPPRKIDPMFIYLTLVPTFPNIDVWVKSRFKRSLLQLLNFLMRTIKLLFHYAVIYLFSRMFTTVFIAHSEAFWHVESTPGLLLTIIALLDSAPLIVGKVIVIVLWGPVLALIPWNTNTFVEIHHQGKACKGISEAIVRTEGDTGPGYPSVVSTY